MPPFFQFDWSVILSSCSKYGTCENEYLPTSITRFNLLEMLFTLIRCFITVCKERFFQYCQVNNITFKKDYLAMSDVTMIAILIILLILSGFIIIANTFTVFVFWIHRIKLKRTFLLVINLTVADLLVGIAQTVLLGLIISKSDYVWISTTFLAAVSGSSVFFLVLISLERAFALIWPLRHRVTSIKVYIYSVVIVWFAGIAIGAFSWLTVYGIFVVTNFVIAYSVVIVLSLFIICLCYLSIRKKLYSPNPAIDKADSRKRMKQNIKVSKTIFFVIGASIAFWAPSMTLYIIKTLAPNLFPRFVTFILFMLHATNSLVNPMIYSFRMVVFRKTLKQLGNKLNIHKTSKKYTFSSDQAL